MAEALLINGMYVDLTGLSDEELKAILNFEREHKIYPYRIIRT